MQKIKTAYRILPNRGKRGISRRLALGFRMLTQGGVPLHIKGFALALGAFFTLALVAFEVPIEGLCTFFLPLLGLPFDLALDGMEVIALPVLFAMLLLPSLVKKQAPL